ncbi:MAG TPA: hypothetical protein VIN59_09160 [Alphaproteobacteria bacterium]
MSLLLALVFVTFFAGALVSIARFNAYQVRENEARVAGNEVIEIAKAARLYVRDLMITNPALRTTAATPTEIPLATLKNAGYLSNNFGRSSGGFDLTALGQRIHVIMTNWPVGGNVNDPATVPTAFVLLRHINNQDRSTAQLMTIAMEVAREQNTSIIAPRFNGATNVSADCTDTVTTPSATGPAASLWDTGCLSSGDFDRLVEAALPGSYPASATVYSVDPGGLMVPVWKVVQPDLRVVMRFPQPENPGFATMLTDLQMGEPVGDCTINANQVQITTTNAAGAVITTPSGLCQVNGDTSGAGGVNRRFNITQVGNMALQRLIAEPQAADNSGFMAAETANIGTINNDSFRVTGNLDLGNDLRIYDQVALPGGVPSRFDVPAGTMSIERNAYLYSTDPLNANWGGKATIGTITGSRSLISNSLNTPRFQSTSASLAGYGNDMPSINVTRTTDIAGDMRITGTNAELLTETLQANSGPDNAGTTTINEARSGADMLATNTTGLVQVSGTLNNNGRAMTIQGTNAAALTSGFSAIVGSLDTGGNIQINNNMTFSDTTNTQITAGASRGYSGASPNVTPVNTITATRCLADNVVANGCPNRQYTPPKVTP